MDDSPKYPRKILNNEENKSLKWILPSYEIDWDSVHCYIITMVPKADLNPHEHCSLPPQDSVFTKFHHFGKKIRATKAQINYK